MPRNYQRKGLRAPKGSVPGRILLRLGGEDLELVRTAAGLRGQTATEWIRGAILVRLHREDVLGLREPPEE